jgi:hypothetical protein
LKAVEDKVEEDGDRNDHRVERRRLESEPEEIVMSQPQKPGEIPARPGEYREVGPRGGEVSRPRTVTIEPGDRPLPPTQEPNRRWERTGPPKK